MERKPSSSEELIEDIVGFSMTVWKSTTDHMYANVFIEFRRGHGKVLEVLDHLEARVGDTSLILVVGEHTLSTFTRSVSPSEDG